jgi:hypothetical protein
MTQNGTRKHTTPITGQNNAKANIKNIMLRKKEASKLLSAGCSNRL